MVLLKSQKVFKNFDISSVRRWPAVNYIHYVKGKFIRRFVNKGQMQDCITKKRKRKTKGVKSKEEKGKRGKGEKEKENKPQNE
jgi:hypothetical protein